MVKEGLYIQGYKADVDDISAFAFTYKNSDVENPEAIKNTYSKTVELKGTNTNNKIFGEIWNLDREIVEDEYENIGVYFNPKKRVSFQLFDNGELLESGYIKLDSINIENNNVVYSLTLFGELGNFFYNLMYNESDEEISMADLKLGLNGEPDNKNRKFFQWDASYIKGSWDKLKSDFNSDDKSVNNWVTSAPTYSGYYDDFDCDKVLVSMDNVKDETKQKLLHKSFIQDGKTYTPKDGYGLLTAQREMDEWEVRDLRSLHQRPAIKTSLLLDAISNPENNGNYIVKWDEEIKNSSYYTKSYIVTNRLKWEDGATNLTALDIDLDSSVFTGETVYFSLLNPKTQSNVFDFSEYNNPHIQLVLNEQIYTDKTNAHCINTSHFTLMRDNSVDFGYTGSVDTNIYGAFVYKVHVYKDNVELPEHSITKLVNICDTYTIKYGKEILTSYIEKMIGTPFNEQVITGAPLKKYPNGDKFYQSEDFDLDFEVPSESNISISIEKWHITLRLHNIFNGSMFGDYKDVRTQLGSVTVDNAFKNKFCPCNIKKVDVVKPSAWYALEKSNTQNTQSAYYDGISSTVQNVDVTKSILLEGLGTPFKILTDFCKIFNLRFRLSYDDFEHKATVNIEQRKNYFINEIINISDKIDYSKSFNIIPTTSEYKFYKFGTENEDTYAYTLYKKKYNDDYSTYTYNSNYNFNNETKELFDDGLFNIAIDYRLNSPYFNTAKKMNNIQFPQICLMPMYTWQLWNASESNEETVYGLQSYYNVPKIQDVPKMCMFDKENENVDMVSLAFFNGFEVYDDTTINNKMPYLLSDNLPIMSVLNDDNPCYLYAEYENGDTELVGKKHEGDSFDSVLAYWITEMPKFSPNCKEGNNVKESFYFKKPNAGYVQENYNSATLLYPSYWKNYISDLYDDSAKQVECYAFIDEKPDVAMRKMYYFKNALWSLNEITDYNYREYAPVQCTFVKIKDIEDYIL